MGGAIAECVYAAVHVGIIAAVVIADGLDHALGLLGGGGVVEVDQRMAVNLLREDREIAAHPRGVKNRGSHADRAVMAPPQRRRDRGQTSD